MRRTVFSVAFAAGFLAAVAAASAQTTPATVGSPVAAPSDVATPAVAPVNNDDVVSCRYDKVTGSLFSKRICHTQREWHQMSVDSKNMMDNLDAHSHVSGPLGGGPGGN